MVAEWAHRRRTTSRRLDGTRLDTPEKLIAYLERIDAAHDAAHPATCRLSDFDPGRLLPLFAARLVDYLIVGGFGAQPHGAHRQTLDIDVVPRSADVNLDRLAAALRVSAPAFEWAA